MDGVPGQRSKSLGAVRSLSSKPVGVSPRALRRWAYLAKARLTERFGADAAGRLYVLADCPKAR
jgi:hypothetical protein